MNKTVSINLANTLFHIDEVAYQKMQRYLEAVKRSFANTPGSDEILSDIEARIAELFSEKMANERQVVTLKEVEAVIAIMGQPEDYRVDEDIFEDEPPAQAAGPKKRPKKLYRDTEHKYVAGVSSGVAHYAGIDPLWIRILVVLLTIGTSGSFIFIYGLLWILIPEAATTAQKLDMRGEPVNISNIERKVKEGFDDVADRVKSVDYGKVGNTVKESGKTFFDTLGDIVLFCFKIFAKLIGILLIVIGATTLIGLFIGLLSVGILDLVQVPGMDFYHMVNSSGLPIWAVSVLAFFAIGVPFFFLMYLGLKILVNNLKSIGNMAKFSLLGLWLLSIVLLVVFGIREATSHAHTGSVTEETEWRLEPTTDTLQLRLDASGYDRENMVRMGNTMIAYTDAGEKTLVSNDVRLNIKKSADSLVRLSLRREADGPTYEKARETAANIAYRYRREGNTLTLNDYLTLDANSKLNDQEVRASLYLPVGTVLRYMPGDAKSYTVRADTDREDLDLEGPLWRMTNNGTLLCLDCPEPTLREKDKEKNRIRINGNGIDITIDEDGEKGKIIINEDGIDIDVKDQGESFKMKLDRDGINIKAKEKQGDTLN
ncbi:PspC domain-containing protein [Maribacter sp. 2307ULW6-5]|uniref:PspC domain-containing protein n=1 Tax=Maribacter sp. 2307ULW6-5 TaxID=3386275 RepID=UPI0039BD1798